MVSALMIVVNFWFNYLFRPSSCSYPKIENCFITRQKNAPKLLLLNSCPIPARIVHISSNADLNLDGPTSKISHLSFYKAYNNKFLDKHLTRMRMLIETIKKQGASWWDFYFLASMIQRSLLA